jgi:phosphoribosylformimino-5-aminoimidazole carboxamide ribotide isomerase
VIIFPAIDIKDGKCVRLTEGRFDKAIVFSDVPALMAQRWQNQGAEYLHVVDLDGALAGESQNLSTIREIMYLSRIPVQVGGGIRDMESIKIMLEDVQVDRVILGSAAVKNPALVKEAVRAYGDKIIVGLDARGDEVAINGWGTDGGMNLLELAKEMADFGVERIIYTDIARDGMLLGINAEKTAKLAQESGLKVIASGGVNGIADIEKLKNYEKDGVEGCIIGKALYLEEIKLPDALAIARGENNAG